MPAAENRGLLIALAGIAVLLASTLLAYRPPAPRGPDAPPGEFSAYRAKAILRDLVGNGIPHPLGSPAGAKVRDAIVERLTALGYSTELQSGFVCNAGVCGSPVNIIAKHGLSSEGSDAVLLAAHYDSVPAGPGASDDGAGVAAALEIARILAARLPPRHPIVLLLTDGEEAGLLGALLFMHGHPLSKRVKAAVNLEARGTSGPSFMFETGAANAWLMSLYASAIARPVTNSLYYLVYKQLPNDTDFTGFKSAAAQGFNFAFIGNVGRYHTPLDNAANADLGSIQHQGDNALAVLAALANAPTLRAVAIPGASFVLLLTAIAAGLGALPSSLTRSGAPPRWATDFAALLPCLVVFGAMLPPLRFLYPALGSLAWPLSTLVLCLGATTLLPLLAHASGPARRRLTAGAALSAAAGALVTLSLPTYSADWPQRINLEYWLDADTGQSRYLARCDSLRLPAALAAAAHFDPVPHPRFAGSSAPAFFVDAPKLALAAPELSLTSISAASSQRTASSRASVTHFELHLRSARGAPEAQVVFPASAQVTDLVLTTPAGPVQAKLSTLKSGATLIDFVSLPADGIEFSVDAAGELPVAIQVFDQSYDFPAGTALQRARPSNAVSSQDGDITVVHRTVSLEPAPDR